MPRVLEEKSISLGCNHGQSWRNSRRALVVRIARVLQKVTEALDFLTTGLLRILEGGKSIHIAPVIFISMCSMTPFIAMRMPAASGALGAMARAAGMALPCAQPESDPSGLFRLYDFSIDVPPPHLDHRLGLTEIFRTVRRRDLPRLAGQN